MFTDDKGAIVLELWDTNKRKVTVFIDDEVSYFKIHPGGAIEEGILTSIQAALQVAHG